jgi:predicted MFS family arabinose efflux permease
VIGFYESVAFAIIDQGLHPAPSFYGVLTSIQGAGAIVGGLTAGRLSRHAGEARLVGLSLGAFAVAHFAYLASSTVIILAAAAFGGTSVE